jgi:hypothetical protein
VPRSVRADYKQNASIQRIDVASSLNFFDEDGEIRTATCEVVNNSSFPGTLKQLGH